MQKYFCSQCGHYSPSESCAVHGEECLVVADPEQFEERPNLSAGRPGNARQAESVPRVSTEGNATRPKPTSDVDKKVPKPPSRPVRIDRPRTAAGPSAEAEILRFRKSERLLHWAIAVPFMVCWASALVLVLVYNPDPLRPFRDFFSWLHRISGVGLIVFPLVVMLKNRKDYRIHLDNITCAWLWTLNDLKWVALMGLAAINKKMKLPDQGKFNAAEKVNFMSVMLACPVFILTGILIWSHEFAWAAWLVHGCLALLVSPTMLGHIYMATVNPDTRIGLRGMISGYVDRQWAKHHYALWYRELFEKDPDKRELLSGIVKAPDRHITIDCPSCTRRLSVSWAWLLEKVFSVKSLLCPNCGATFAAIAAVTDEQQLQWIKEQFQKRENEKRSGADVA